MKVLRKKFKGRKLNNRGFSIVEILVAMAILGVVSLTIYSFMITGSRFYGKASSDADIQSEAQLVANTISDLIIDCEVNISYDDQISNSINSQAGFIQAQGRTLEISNTDYQFLIFHDGEKLFYLERRPDPANPAVYEAYNINNSELLAENITAFDVDLSRVSGTGKGKNIVTFTMTYEAGGRSYSGNYQVNLRNAITVSANSITPQTKDPNMTRVDVSPRPIYIDIKGRTNPVMWVDGLSQKNTNGQPEALSDNQRERKFTANSDAVNVGRDDIYKWEISGENGTATVVSATNQREFTIRIEENLTGMTIPNHFTVIAEATIPNAATGENARGTAEVYYKKINGLAIVPTRGVTSDKADPGSQVIFAANIDDFNLTAADRTCTWVLEYKTPNMTDYAVCTNTSYASGRVVGASYSVQLGSAANENFSFRLTATSNWDDTWSDQYTFGVTELATVPGIDTASRGVEFDVTALYTEGELAEEGAKSWISSKCGTQKGVIDRIIDAEIVTSVGQNNADLIELVVRDGKLYMYLDYDALYYSQGSRILKLFQPIEFQISIWYVCKVCGETHFADGGKLYIKGVNIKHSSPVFPTVEGSDKEGTVLIQKGGHQDISFTTQAYNISKKNHIGVYLNGVNVNATEFGMMDTNEYLAANYISPLGNRYTLIQSGVVRLTAKPEQAYYPTDAIPVRMSLEEYYKAVKRYSSDTSDDAKNASYTFNVYVANVEGMDLFVRGPVTRDEIKNWSGETTVAYNKTETHGNAQVTSSDAEKKTIVYDQDITVGNHIIQFHAVKTSSGDISYYQMTVDGDKTYYYNTTYRYWRLQG